MILEFGADPNIPNVNGMTPLHCLLELYTDKLEKKLITQDNREKYGKESGACLDITDENGDNPLDMVVALISMRKRGYGSQVRQDGVDIMRFMLDNVKPGCVSERLKWWATGALASQGVQLN
ncbi:hypothetical protein B0T16DRAFT_387784 [Cercophora newfieldiana]|uniref:Uncharacterized protein n=1 Tax=Cercophora newfieldiana TaxID=92897 RepID=A0AA40CV36_9PEZI|nr:hypothetical protein B0T16DRAFT_387784 [Cercophora newfieldiana]